MGSLARLIISERLLALEVQSLANLFMRLDILNLNRIMSCVEAISSLLEQIRIHQYNDEKLCKIIDKVMSGEAKETVIDGEGVLRIKGRVCVPRVGDLTRLIIEEALILRYLIDPGKLSLRYIKPFEILQRVGEVAYELVLPPGISGIHLVFHISMPKKYHVDGSYIIQWDSMLLDQNLRFEEEPVAILDGHVRKLRSKEIVFVKV
ncbi:hypothetical protein K7X08_010507 [Anisodus acutangulus]|uniref:Tf2-1-like SH3-like domain-containing protein n=1 Tax=Anisodus acutangulus TaxID=402998 RepID=A0A9Q1RV73_9SOLA|nr:hypothetical protein K7X08_010507 [Anisodus acutangulus]